MNKTTTLFAGALLAVAASATFAGNEKTDKLVDEAKAAVTPGEVVLTGADTKTLHDGKTQAYRVCVKQESHAGSVRIMNDASSKTLEPGACENVSGARITATPSKPLMGDMRSTVTFDKR